MIAHLRGRPLTLRHLGKLFYRLVQQARDRWVHDLFRDGPTTYAAGGPANHKMWGSRE